MGDDVNHTDTHCQCIKHDVLLIHHGSWTLPLIQRFPLGSLPRLGEAQMGQHQNKLYLLFSVQHGALKLFPELLLSFSDLKISLICKCAQYGICVCLTTATSRL